MLCKECYYCSKCKTNPSFAKGVEIEGKQVYQGSICKSCFKELIKCEECKTNSAVKPDGSIRTKQNAQQQKVKVCESCLKKSTELKKLAQEYKAKLNKILPPTKNKETYYDTVSEHNQPLNLSVEKLKELKSLLVEIDKIGKNREVWWEILGCPLIDAYLLRLDEKIKKQEQNTSRSQTKPTTHDKKDLCEGCGVVEREWRIVLHLDDFTDKIYWFGDSCSCRENFKKQNQKACDQCGKKEFPSLSKGWVVDDTGIGRKSFCSSLCHVKYQEAQWEKENQTKTSPTPKPKPSEWIKKAKLPSLELKLSSKGEKEFDWEKEGAKKEVLTLKKITKVLSKSEDELELAPIELGEYDGEAVKRYEEALERKMKIMIDTLNIEENEIREAYSQSLNSSLQQAQKAFESKYSKAELNTLLKSSNQQQSKRNYWPLVVGIGLVGIGLVVGLIYYFWSKKKASK